MELYCSQLSTPSPPIGSTLNKTTSGQLSVYPDCVRFGGGGGGGGAGKNLHALCV